VFFSSLTDLLADGEQLVTRKRFSGFCRVDLQAGFLGNCFSAVNMTIEGDLADSQILNNFLGSGWRLGKFSHLTGLRSARTLTVSIANYSMFFQ
jgi:hypothetical protein